MRPFRGVVSGNETIECENGLVISGIIPKGIKRFDAVLVCYDFTKNEVVSIEPDFPSEEVVELDRYVEAPLELEADGELDDVVETDETENSEWYYSADYELYDSGF